MLLLPESSTGLQSLLTKTQPRQLIGETRYDSVSS